MRTPKAAPKEIRIGTQKGGFFPAVKARHTLDDVFKPLGIEIKWVDFQFGPPLLEAINVGSVDFGYVGDAPPIFAQAASARIRGRQAEWQHAGDHRAAGFADQDAGRSQGQAHRFRQGIERA
jgi:ABC-type nitrate/sulfonate/bicarbonate transport system substrate-binding protein